MNSQAERYYDALPLTTEVREGDRFTNGYTEVEVRRTAAGQFYAYRLSDGRPHAAIEYILNPRKKFTLIKPE